MTPTRLLLVDRDGTLIEEPEDFQVDRLEKVRWLPGVGPALKRLQDHGWKLVMVTNQDGLGTERFPREAFDLCQNHILAELQRQGVEFYEVHVDEHFAHENHPLRKPNTGRVKHLLELPNLDLNNSWVVGDRSTDALLAQRLGLRSITIQQPGAPVGESNVNPHTELETAPPPSLHLSAWTQVADVILQNLAIK